MALIPSNNVASEPYPARAIAVVPTAQNLGNGLGVLVVVGIIVGVAVSGPA